MGSTRSLRFRLALGSAIGIALLTGVPASAANYQLPAARDTWLDEDEPDTVRGDDTELRAATAAGASALPLLAFDLSVIPPGEVVTGATLALDVDRTDSASVAAHAASIAWTEALATWNNTAFPTDTTSRVTTFVPAVPALNVDLTGLLQAWTTTRPGETLALVASGAAETWYRSRESASAPQRPTLQVTTVADAGLVDVGLLATVDKSAAAVGDTLTYTVTATNFGGTAATSVSVGLFTPWYTTRIGSSTTQGTYNDLFGTWSVGALAPGVSATLSLRVVVQSGGAGRRITNTAFLWGTYPSDAADGNNQGLVYTDIAPDTVVDVVVSKAVDDPAPTIGQPVRFTITARNAGTGEATGVTVTDLLPAGLAYTSSDPASGVYDSGTGAWGIGVLGPGTATTLELTATVEPGFAGATLWNVARVTGLDQVDADPTSDADSASVSIAAADLAVTLDADDTHPREGDTVTWTVTVANLGPSPAGSVALDMVLPDGLSFDSAVPVAGTYDPGSGRWSAGTVGVGASVQLFLATSVDPGTAAAVLELSAAVAGADVSDPVAGNDAAALSVTVQGADVGVALRADDVSPREGGAVTFVLTASNAGPDGVTGLSILAPIPAGLSVSGGTASRGSWDSGSGIWDVGVLTAGAADSLVITATVDPGTAGDTLLVASAITARDPADPVPANDADSVSVIVRSADIEITKTPDLPVVDEGGSVGWTIVARNLGPFDADSVRVADVLPAGLTWSGDTPSQGSYAPGSGVWDVGGLPAGNAATLTILTQVDPGTAGTEITNTASALGADLPDPVSGNDAQSAVVRVRGADLRLTKAASPPAPAVGTPLAYTITLANNGPDAATAVAVVDSLPAGVTYASHTATTGSYDLPTGTWTVPVLGDSTVATLTLHGLIAPGTEGTTLVNRARVASAAPADPAAGNEADSVSVTIPLVVPGDSADLAIGQAVSDSGPREGDAITITLDLTNLGPDPADAVELLDALPAGLALIGATATQGAWVSGTGTWSAGTLGSGQTETLQIQATVAPGTAGTTIRNTATVSGSSVPDPVPGNNTMSRDLLVESADLSVAGVVDDAAPDEGDPVAITVTLANAGADAAGGVVVDAAIPPGLSFAAASPEKGSYSPATGLWTVGAMANGESVDLVLDTVVDAGTAATAVVAAAVVAATDQGDPDAANDTTRVTITVRGADVSPVMTADDTTPDVGQRVRLTLAVTNEGPDAAEDLVVEAALGPGLLLAGAAPSTGSYDSGTGAWTIGTLAASSSAQLLLDVDVASGTGGTSITSTARILARTTGDPDASNDTTSVRLDVSAPVGIAVTASQATATARPGASGRNLFALVIANHSESLTSLRSVGLANRTSGPGTPAQRDGDLGAVFLYRDDGDQLFDPALDVAISAGSVADGAVTFSGFNNPIQKGTSRAFFVVGGPSLAARDGDILDFALESGAGLTFSAPQTFTTAFPVDPSGGTAVDGMVAAQCLVTTLSAAFPLTGAPRVLAAHVRIPANGYAPDTLTGLTLAEGGTAVPGSDVTAVELWLDGGDGVWGDGGGDDTLAGTASSVPGGWAFTGLSAPIPAAGRVLFAAVDIAGSAVPGRTVKLSVPAPAGIGMASANDGPLDAPLPSSRTLTIASATGTAVVTAGQSSGILRPGDVPAEVLTFVVRNASARAETLLAVRVDNLTIGGSGASVADLDADWTPLALVRDPSFGASGAEFSAADPPTAAFVGGRATFATLERIAAGDSARFQVEGAASLVARDGDLLDLGLPADALTFTAGGPVPSGLPASPGGGFLVDGMTAAQAVVRSTSGALFTGNARQPVLDVQLPANGYEPDTLLRLDVIDLGAAGAGALTAAELWVDDGDGTFDEDLDRLLGALAYTGERWEITGLSEDVPVGAGIRLHVTADVSELAVPGSTVRFALPGPPETGVGMESGNDGPIDAPIRGDALTIGTVDRVTLSAPGVASRKAAPGAAALPLLQLAATNSYATPRTVTEMRVRNTSAGPGTIAHRDAQFDRLAMWADDGDGVPEGAPQDTLLAVSSFRAGQAAFTGLDWTIPPGASRRCFVLADLSVPYAADGDTLSAALNAEADVEFATATAVAAGWPLDSGARHVVDGMVAAQITRLDPPPVTLGPSGGPVLALGVVLPGRGYDGDRLTSLSVENRGSAGAADVATLRLWRDGGDGAFDAAAGDDVNLGILAPFADRWTHPALAETLLAGGSRFWISARASSAPQDSATIRLAIPQDGLVVASGNDGPVDAAVVSANTITLSTSVLLTSLAIRPAASTVDSTVTVTMTVQNVHPSAVVDSVTASALTLSGTGLLTPVAGPSPAMLTLGPGAADSISWTYRADAPGPVRLSGSAQGVESGTGVVHRSLAVESGQHTVFLSAQDLNLYAVESMPFSVSRGQTGIVPISLTFENPAGTDGSDILVTRLRLRVEDETGADVPPAALLSRILVSEGAVVYCDRTALETSGATADLPLSPALRVEASGASSQATVALAIDVSDSTTIGSFRIQVVDASWVEAEDATSGGPVAVTLVAPPAFPVSSGLARVVADAIRLDVAGISSPDGGVGRGQADVELLTLSLQNTDPAGLAADVRVPSFAVLVTDTSGAPVPDAGAILARIRVTTDNVLHLDRAVASGGGAVTLDLSPLVSIPVNTPISVRVAGTFEAAAPLGPVRFTLAGTSQFVARDANTAAPVPVYYATDPLPGRTLTVQAAVAAVGAVGAARMPATVAVGSRDVAAMDVVLTNPGVSGGAAAIVDQILLECRDALGAPLAPDIFLDRVAILADGVEAGAVVTLPATGAGVAIPLSGVSVAPSDSVVLTVRFDAEVTAPAARLELSVPADGVAARDGNLGTPVPVIASGGAFPLRSGVGQLLQPSRELAVAFADRMPAVLAADGGEIDVATLTVRNPAPSTSGPLRLVALTLRAADGELGGLAIGRAIERIAVRVDGSPWGELPGMDTEAAVARIAPIDALELAPGATIDLQIRATLRRGGDASSLRLGVTAADFEATSGGGAFLGVSVLAEDGQSLPFWTATGNFGGTTLAESWSNFPNPFAAGREPTRFAFYLPREGRVTVRLRSIRGDEVKVLLDGEPLGAGLHQDVTWDGRNGRGEVVRNGVYLAEVGVAYVDGTSETTRRKVAVVR